MRKVILNVSLLMMLAGAMSTTVVSCKDYDEDITNINENTDGLSKQIDALNAALEQYKSEAAAASASAQQAIKDAAAAAAKGDQAMAAAKAAEAQADLAKQAAAQAKADAIEEMKKLLSEADAKNAKEIAALAGRIDGIENGLKNIDLTDINKQLGEQAATIAQLNKDKEALQVQINTLMNFKSSVEAQLSTLQGIVNGLSTDLGNVKSQIVELTGKLTTLQGTVNELLSQSNANKGKIDELDQALKGISTEIGKINTSLTTIAGVMGNRLSSVTLIPDLYVGGIPAIEFQSARYVAMEGSDKDGYKVGKKTFIISNDETTATYRMNPSTITLNDIVKTGISYVSSEARVRARVRGQEVENDLIQTVPGKTEIDAFGRLSVRLKKSNTASLNHPKDGYVYTVSLKVPVAEKHLFEGENSFSVFSEYTSLSETYFQPELRFIDGSLFNDISKNADGAPAHMSTKAEAYASKMNMLVATKLAYDATLDLDKLVTGWKYFDSDHGKDVMLTHEQLAEYGLDIRYFVPEQPYFVTSDDKTDQQKFARISGSTLTPVTATGQANNESIIGRQPIIGAVLYDKSNNNNVVDCKYFKVLYTAKAMEPVKVDFPGFDAETMTCEEMPIAVTWSQFQEYVLEKYDNNKGISKEDFAKIYKVDAASTQASKGALSVDIIQDGTGGSTPIIEWVLNPDDLSPVKPGQVITLTATVVFYDPQGLRPNLVVTLTRTIKVPGEAKLGSTHGNYWKDNVLLIYPVPMQGTVCGSQVADYNTNILQDRVKPYVTGLLDCANWDVDLAKKSPYSGYIAINDENGQRFQHWGMNEANQKYLDHIYYTIANDAAGKALVEKANNDNHYYDVAINWMSNVNGNPKNAYTFATSTLRILQILKVDAKTSKGVKDDSHSEPIKLGELVTMHDAYGNLVANTAGLPGEYYKFYGVKSIVFSNKVQVANTLDGKRVTLGEFNDDITVTVSSDGTFNYANAGAPLVSDIYIFVPVTITHRWGVLKTEVAVPVAHKF